MQHWSSLKIVCYPDRRILPEVGRRLDSEAAGSMTIFEAATTLPSIQFNASARHDLAIRPAVQ